ncbi:MAG: rod shape-determining protein MreD [Pirellulales bacterium]|nr:rod shape-determining protein MreD [Pirellulales bacterium]
MPVLFLIPLVYLAALADVWLSTHWEIRGIVPDLLALVVFAWLAVARGRYAFVVTAFVGLVGDLNSSAPLGIGMAAFALVGYSIIFFRRHLHLDGSISQLVVISLGTMTACGLQGIGLRLAGSIEIPFTAIVEHAALVGLYTSGIAIPVLMLVRWVTPQRKPTPLVAPTP